MTEQLWIDRLSASNPILGLNKSASAFNAISGVPRTVEHNAKIGAAHIGMKRTEEARIHMRNAAQTGPNPDRMRAFNHARIGLPLSAEHKVKLSVAGRGQPKSEAHKKAIADAMRRRFQTEEGKIHTAKAVAGRWPLVDKQEYTDLFDALFTPLSTE